MENQESEADIESQTRQATEAGCSGLLQGHAFSTSLRTTVNASDASRADGPFICSECSSDAVLRHCCEKRDHFAHHARMSPAIGPGESELHRECLKEICGALSLRFPGGNWAINRPIESNPKKGIAQVVPDVSGRIGNQRLVIEAQVSCLSIPEIIKRTKVYHQRDIPVLWIVPLREDIGNELIRPRLYERYLHAMYFGRVYYWSIGSGTCVLPVHFSPAKRHIPHSAWFDTDTQEERSVGGYDKMYKVIKQPTPSVPINFADSFHPEKRSEFRPWNERKLVPPLSIWRDNLPEWWSATDEHSFFGHFKEDSIPTRVRKRKQETAVSLDWSQVPCCHCG